MQVSCLGYSRIMKNLQHELKPLIVEAVHAAYPDLGVDELTELVRVEDPRDPAHGDAATPIAMSLAKRLGKSPLEIARNIVEHFPQDFRVQEVSYAPPGFINVRFSVAFLNELLNQLENGFSVEGTVPHDQPVIVEYPSTNAAKHMGAHHIITTVLGDALANLFEFMGYEVMRINHFGDWGTHFGKLIYAVEQWGDMKQIHENPTDELNRLYVQFNQAAEEKPELEDEARRIFKELEDGDPKRIELWQWIVKESLEELDRILKRLWIGIERHMGESFYLKKSEEVLADGIKRGLFVEGEKGALIFNMGEDETPALVQKSDGTTLYLTRDVATIQYRVDTWHPEAILYVVQHAQSLHFQQNFAIAKAMGYAGDTQLEHISFGLMRFADGKMSTRKGNVIKLDDLLNEAVNRAQTLTAARGSELPRGELSEMLEVIGVSSLKYGILSQDRNKDIIFDWDKIITLEGNSAPYLLYSYARARSIVNKVNSEPLSGMPELTEEPEIQLMRKLVKFPQVLSYALADRKPHSIGVFLFELCQTFNRFYEKVPVANAETSKQQRSRLGLIHAYMFELKAGLQILGIPVLERM